MVRPTLHKSILELRYKPSLRFYDQLFSAASSIEDYPHWETNQSSVILKDPVHRCSLSIGHAMVAYRQNSADLNLHANRTAQMIDSLLPALGVDSCTRCGFRRLMLATVQMDFDDLVPVLDAKLLSGAEGLKSILPGLVSDLNYRIDLKDEQRAFHLNIGPLRKSEVPQYIQVDPIHLDPDEPNETLARITESYPDVSVFIDLDIYREGAAIGIDEIQTFLRQAEEEGTGFSESLCDYLFAARLEVPDR